MFFIPSISNEDFKTLQNSGKNFSLLDVREQSEWDEGYIKNAIHIPLSALESKIKEESINDNELIIVYCARGRRSSSAQKTLSKMGYKNVFSLKGGYNKF